MGYEVYYRPTKNDDSIYNRLFRFGEDGVYMIYFHVFSLHLKEFRKSKKLYFPFFYLVYTIWFKFLNRLINK